MDFSGTVSREALALITFRTAGLDAQDPPFDGELVDIGRQSWHQTLVR